MGADVGDRGLTLLADDLEDQGQAFEVHEFSRFTIHTFSLYGKGRWIQGRRLDHGRRCCGPGYASPAEAIRAPREKLLYTIAIYTGTGIQKPDYLATVDADPDSPTYPR